MQENERGLGAHAQAIGNEASAFDVEIEPGSVHLDMHERLLLSVNRTQTFLARAMQCLCRRQLNISLSYLAS